MSALISFFVPGGLFTSLAVGLVLGCQDHDWFAALARVFPVAIGAAGLLYGWRANRSRLAIGILILAFADRALLKADVMEHGGILRDLIAVLLPANLTVLALAEERGVLTGSNAWRTGLLLAQAATVTGLVRFHPKSDMLRAVLTHETAMGRFTVPGLAHILFAAALVAAVAAFALHRGPVEGGFFWAVLCAWLGVVAARSNLDGTIYMASAGAIMIASVIEGTHLSAMRDELTGLPARRALTQAMADLSGDYAVAMVDVDHFKKFNDRFGHPVGDQVLRMVASKLREHGGGGRAFRYGGEEFAIVFPGKSAEEAAPMAEALRIAVEKTHFIVRGRRRPRRRPKKPALAGGSGLRAPVTISIGLAGSSARLPTPDAVLKAADRALYRAKESGRNRVVCA